MKNHRHNPTIPQHRGFTLVELLVVIAIVAVLATVAFMMAGKALARSRETKCLTYIRQVGGLMNGYAASNNGYFPEAGMPNGYITRLCEDAFPDSFPSANEPDADRLRQKFFMSQTGSMFMCPENKQGNRLFNKSFLVNGRITGIVSNEDPKTYQGGEGVDAYVPIPIPRIFNTTRALLLIEGWNSGSRQWQANGVRYSTDNEQAANFDAHRKGRHYIFVDGHAEWLLKDPGRKSQLAERVYYRGQNPDTQTE